MSKYNNIELNTVWISENITEDTIKWAKGFGKFLAKSSEDDGVSIPDSNARAMTTSQLRRFFGEVKRIENDFEKYQMDVVMLQPMLAYASGRDKKFDSRSRQMKNETRLGEFATEMEKVIDAIKPNEANAQERFVNFVKIFESIVAFHKFYGGKENK